MKQIATAIVIIQLALVSQCTHQAKRDEDNEEFRTNMNFQSTCSVSMTKNRQNLDDKFKPLDPPQIKYMYPCEKCNSHQLDIRWPIYDTVFYKYVEKTDFFVVNMTLNIQIYKEICECDLNAKEEDIAKAIDAYKKEHFDVNCSKMNPTKEKAFDLNPAKLKECFQSTKEGESKAKFRVQWSSATFPILVQEILDKIKDTVTYNVLQKELLMNPIDLYAYRIVEGEEPKDQKMAECLKENNFFLAGPYRYLDHIIKCGKNKGQMFFRDEIEYGESCRDGSDDPEK